ncbi:MAG: hypothetical protein N2C14_27490 [Planctomycetales bacterium]
MTGPGVRVVKLGGRLLESRGLGDRLQAWKQRQPPARNCLIVGGGRLADAVREWDAVHELGAEAAHELAVRAMTLNARLMLRLLADAVLTDAPCDFETWGAPDGWTILDPSRFVLGEDETDSAPRLPASWEVTSDSIAAFVAGQLGGAELVLLKSALPTLNSTRAEASAAGYVDAYFPTAAANVARVRCVDLSDDGFPEVRLQWDC